MNEQPKTPSIPEGKTTAEELIRLGWQDVSGKKGPKRFVWRNEIGKIIAHATISHQGFADMTPA